MITYVKGDIISLTRGGNFNVVAHGVNCFNTQTRGVAKHFADAFKTNDPNLYKLEQPRLKGDINKLGQIEYRVHVMNMDQLTNKGDNVVIVNAYTQYRYGTQQVNLDYDALRLCLKKINFKFKGKSVLLPLIGVGVGGGDWQIIERIIKQELHECAVTIVNYEREGDKARQEHPTS